MKKILACAALALSVFALAGPAFAIKLYQTKAEAQVRCKSGVVWLNAKTMIYHMPGTRGNGTTKGGAFVCHAAAEPVRRKKTNSETRHAENA